MQKISVIGQGYVGLPIAMAAAESGLKVCGIDINAELVAQLNQGLSYLEDVDPSKLKNLIADGKYTATTDFVEVAESSVILLCVPTPLTSERNPDLQSLINAITSLGKYIKKNTLVIIESTVAPGTTRNLILPLLEYESKLTSTDFKLAFSPERIDPQNPRWKVSNTPKLVAGLTSEASAMASKFYSKFIDQIVECESLEVAEMAKLLENSFRLVNISFINELAILCDKLQIDINKVIESAGTKPYGFMPFFPSLGAGGHCIPVDPIYLLNKSSEVGIPNRFIELADKVNQEMPQYFITKAERKLNGLVGKRILILGVAYKKNVADVRETPVKALILGLKKRGAKVSWHDDLVKEWNGDKSVAISSNFDLAILATPHDYLDLTALGKIPILDTRNSI